MELEAPGTVQTHVTLACQMRVERKKIPINIKKILTVIFLTRKVQEV